MGNGYQRSGRSATLHSQHAALFAIRTLAKVRCGYYKRPNYHKPLLTYNPFNSPCELAD